MPLDAVGDQAVEDRAAGAEERTADRPGQGAENGQEAGNRTPGEELVELAVGTAPHHEHHREARDVHGGDSSDDTSVAADRLPEIGRDGSTDETQRLDVRPLPGPLEEVHEEDGRGADGVAERQPDRLAGRGGGEGDDDVEDRPHQPRGGAGRLDDALGGQNGVDDEDEARDGPTRVDGELLQKCDLKHG